MCNRSMTREQYRALRRAVWRERRAMNEAIIAAEWADSPSWAIRRAEERGEENLHQLIARFPVAMPSDWPAFNAMQRRRRSDVLARIAERRRLAQLHSPRLAGESLLDCVSRRCGFVKDVAH